MARIIGTVSGVAFSLVLGLAAPPSLAQEQEQERQTEQTREQEQERTRAALPDNEPVYGWEMMTNEEREQHRTQMRNATTEQERERLRQENHRRMEERARERGKTLAPPHSMRVRKSAGPGGGSGGPGGGPGGPGGGPGPGAGGGRGR